MLNTCDCKETDISTLSKIGLMALLPLVTLIASCSWSGSQSASSANASALYDPPTVTLIEGQSYQFKEGVLVGRKDHKFHSDYSYRRAVIIGDK
tara:strand:- start:1162 stop:1443 length:282 start_codon:yes stop_codon:yes gene_type:complete